MVKKKTNYQESGTANIQNITSNQGPLIPKPALWLHLSWVDLIYMPLIIVMLRFTLHSFQLNLSLGLFHIHTTLWLNKLIMMKRTISRNSYTHNMIKIFWMLIFRCFRLDWWLLLLQILYSLYCIVSCICRSKYCGHQLHVTPFYVCPNQCHYETC